MGKRIIEATREELDIICSESRGLEKQRAWFLKGRNDVANRCRAGIAREIGYSPDIKSEEERKKFFARASNIMKTLLTGKPHEEANTAIEHYVAGSAPALDAMEEYKALYESQMTMRSKRFPLRGMIMSPEFNGFGFLFYAILVGELGNLSRYNRVSQAWKMLSQHPIEKNGEVHMGSVWRQRINNKTGLLKLDREDWIEAKYSPRRNSLCYVMGCGLIKQNYYKDGTDGPYRARYMSVKHGCFRDKPHWDWKVCETCNGTGYYTPKNKKKPRFPQRTTCTACGGMKHQNIHAYRHANLLARKMLIKDIVLAWHQLHPPEDGISIPHPLDPEVYVRGTENETFEDTTLEELNNHELAGEVMQGRA